MMRGPEFTSRHLRLEGIIVVRLIGQESHQLGATAERKTSLDELQASIDFAPTARASARLYRSAMGKKARPPLARLKALLLTTWHDLSDLMLAEALSNRASFRRFCGFARGEETPGHTGFVRFRRQLAAQGDHSLFEAMARDLKRKGTAVRKGTLLDATVIRPASRGDKGAA